MSQVLLDGSAETISVQERLDFLRKMEDSQTPVTLIDQRGQKHQVYISKVSYARPTSPLDGNEEPQVTVIAVDAHDGLWPMSDNLPLGVTVAVATNVVSQTNFVWGTAAADTFDWNRGQWE